MNLFELSDYAYPTAIVAAFVTVTLCKSFDFIKPKYYPLIAIITGVLIMKVDNIVAGTFDARKVVTGAMSGLIAIGSHEVFKNYIKKNDEEE